MVLRNAKVVQYDFNGKLLLFLWFFMKNNYCLDVKTDQESCFYTLFWSDFAFLLTWYCFLEAKNMFFNAEYSFEGIKYLKHQKKIWKKYKLTKMWFTEKYYRRIDKKWLDFNRWMLVLFLDVQGYLTFSSIVHQSV